MPTKSKGSHCDVCSPRMLRFDSIKSSPGQRMSNQTPQKVGPEDFIGRFPAAFGCFLLFLFHIKKAGETQPIPPDTTKACAR